MALDFYVKSMLLLGKEEKVNFPRRNYYISCALEAKTGRKPQFNDEMRGHLFDKVPLEYPKILKILFSQLNANLKFLKFLSRFWSK